MQEDRILLAHGGGGQLTAELIEQIILPALGGQEIGSLADAALLPAQKGELAMTTDTYVVAPLEFPGGDIGKLAVCGTINDLAVVGARPIGLSMGLILEEGLEVSLLKRVMESAGAAARAAGVAVVTGDTKVVERGKCDGIYINTAGVGVKQVPVALGLKEVRSGDAVLATGELGDHGLAIMSLRKGLQFSSELRSDCAALHRICEAVLVECGAQVHFMRDLTRGGLAAALADVATWGQVDIEIEEEAIPVGRTAQAAAELLGLDVLNVANEGKLVIIVAAEAAERAVQTLRRFPESAKAAVIGRIGNAAGGPGIVEMTTVFGGKRVIQMPYGEELPRIC